MISFDRFLFWFRGYYNICFGKSCAERFISLCNKNDICMRQLYMKEEHYYTKIPKKSYSAAEAYISKAGVECNIVSENGFPYLIKRHRKKLVFFLCLLFFVMLLQYFTTFIWEIKINADEIYTNIQIEKYIKSEHVGIGTKKSSISCEALENALRQKYPGIAWISCEIKGSTLIVKLSETVERKDTVPKSDKPCNIVAVKSALITDIIASKGMPVVEKGAEVKKGDILISGVINITNDYDELIETSYITAEGEVYGIVNYDYSDTFSLNEQKKEYKSTSHALRILFMDRSLTIGKKKNSAYTDIVENTSTVKIFGYSMPVSFSVLDYKKYDIKNTTLTSEEAVDKAKLRLTAYIDNLRKKGVVILENNVKIYVNDNVVRSEGTIKTKELIGVPKELNMITQGE